MIDKPGVYEIDAAAYHADAALRRSAVYDRQSSTTVCAQCAMVLVPFKSAPWWRWLCTANKVVPVYNPVTGQQDREEPYERCRSINAGDCSKYLAGPNAIHPRATAEGEVE